MISQASSEHSICFTVPETEAARAVAALREAFTEEIERREIDDIELMTGLATIAVVGSGMVHTPGIAARIFGAVADAEANVVAIAQGASERIISFVVDGGQAPAALRAVHSRLPPAQGRRREGRHVARRARTSSCSASAASAASWSARSRALAKTTAVRRCASSA